MKLHTIIIQPEAPFGTPLKGDTIFGHFCWQAAETGIVTDGLDRWIDCYGQTPFALFSSAFPMVRKGERTFFAMPRPRFPARPPSGMEGKERFQRLENRKKDKKKKYLLVGEDLRLVFTENRYCSEKDLFDLHLTSLPVAAQKKLKLLAGSNRKFSGVFEQAHNTLNRLTSTTGNGEFAPFSAENIHYLPKAQLAVFVLVNEQAIDIDRVKAAFVNMGRWGFGRDASAGLGRFSVVDVHARQIPESGGRARYTLAPCVPEKDGFSTSFFTPFTRFGKHGVGLIQQNKPFKNPVVMADEGAIFVPGKQPSTGNPLYVGRAVTDLSKADKRTVMQGYAITLPCELEGAL